MARRKSINDMQTQLSRMHNYNTFSMSRIKKADSTYRRYRDNIQKSLGLSRGRNIDEKGFQSDLNFSKKGFQSIGAINKARVPSSIYMGLSNG